MRISRRALFRLSCLGLTAAAVVGIMLAPSPWTAAPVTSAPLRTIPGTDVNPLGATFFLEREVEAWKRELTVKMAREAGLGWAKVMFPWQEIEPRKGRYYDDRYRKSSWEKYDEILALLERYNLRLIARLDKPPEWALMPPGQVGDRGTPLVSIADYANFVGEVARRYRGRVQHYQIWNEPNLAAEWGGLRPNAAAYTELLKAAAAAIRAADPDALILTAPLAQTTERSERAIPDLDFLDEMYRAGAAAAFDILSANAYGFDRPPTDPARPEALNFQRVTLLREKMVERGDAKKPVWLSEVAWNAAPDTFPRERLHWGRVPEEKQAEYIVEAIRLARRWDWAGVVNLWYFRQVGDISPAERADYYFRVVDVDFTPRLVYHGLKQLAAGLLTAPPGRHQETSSGVDVRGSWQYRRALDADMGGYIVSTRPGSSLTFSFYGGEVSLIVRRSPQGGLAEVKLNGADPPGWSSPGRRAVLDFSSSALEYETVPIASGLGPGPHTLQLRVIGTGESAGEVALDAIEVGQAHVSTWPFFVQIALALLGLAGLVSSFLQRSRQ
ncbi:MAG: hypothetical protein RMM58_09790 [Chloroflexota bacterium]|nr:hypothetical protein [Dehalococcoidia bacterium]MDW8254160.1 hypothetical protein [Chloroflexota bacterium]